MLTPVPLMVVPRGVLVIVQAELEGKPLKITFPVATVHVGCVIVPTVGAGGAVASRNPGNHVRNSRRHGGSGGGRLAGRSEGTA